MRIPGLLLSLLLTTFTQVLASQDDQIAMTFEPEFPVYVPQTTSKPTLADLLTIEPSASIFYSYARELELSSVFSDQGARLTVFAPTNKAIMALARKPHEGPDTAGEIELSEEQFDTESKKNVERWVSAHIIPEYPLSFDSNKHDTLLDGKSISFKPISKAGGEGPEWGRFTLDNGAKIIEKKEGLNGDLYIIDDTISVD